MRYANGELIGDLNDDVFATSSKDIASTPALNNFNENETFYDLLPVIVNRPPVIAGSIVLESDPNIKDIDLTDGTGTQLYVNRDGVVRVTRNATITFRFKARQPSVANIENGVLQVIPDDKKIKYIWRKDDAVVSSFTIPSVKSKTTVNNNELTIERIQIRHNGVYTCDAVNDIGTTTSEPITIEVVDPYEDTLLFRNLVENPYGKDGTQGWNSNNQNFTTKQFTNVSSVDLKTPHRVDLFGYNVDMMHPRPYQIDAGPIRGVDFYNDLTTDAGTFFTRTPYKYDMTDGEPMYVSAYQDIDLADVADMIRGGVYGMTGLRAVFTCYIGNAVTTYIPTKDNASITDRLSKAKYFSGAPRLSLENFLVAGPSRISEWCSVTLEEFEDETRLVSTLLGPNGEPIPQTNTITIKDPWDWMTVRSNYRNNQYYPEDYYQLGSTSRVDSSFDIDLFTADGLEAREDRFTFGQYVKFNKLIIDKLNPKTNKVRIGIHFNNSIPQLTTTYKKQLDSGDPTDIPDWQRLHKKNTFEEEGFGYFERINNPTPNGLGLKSAPPRQKYTYLQSPRPMVTGVTFGLIPIVQDNPQRTAYETATAFTLNTLPAGFVPNVLTLRPYDPTGRLRRDITTRFSHRSTFGESTLSGAETIVGLGPDDLYQDTTFIQSKLTSPSVPSFVQYLTGSDLFPFAQGVGATYAANQNAEISTEIKKYGIVVGRLHGGESTTLSTGALRIARERLHQAASQLSLISNLNQNASPYGTFDFERQVWIAGYGKGTTKAFDEDLVEVFQSTWHKKARFICHYVRNRYPPIELSAAQQGNVTSVSIGGDVNTLIEDTIPIDGNSYYVELDLTDSESPKSFIWRDSNLVGMHTGSNGSQSIFGPFQMETSYTNDNTRALHFKLPDQIVQSSLVSGGLELSRNIPISISLSSATSSVQNGAALVEMLSNPEGFRAVVQSLGENVGRTLVANMWPDASMFAVTPAFTASEAFVDYIEFNRRLTYDYLTQIPSGSTSITVPYRFGPVEDFLAFFPASWRIRNNGTTSVSVAMLVSQSDSLYGTTGTRLHLKRLPANPKYILCTVEEFNQRPPAQREVVYASPTFLRLGGLQGTSTDSVDNSFTINISRSFDTTIADQAGYDVASQNETTIGVTGIPGNRYIGISFNDTRFSNAIVDVLAVDFNTPSTVLVRNAASSLYAVEIAPFSPSPIYESFEQLSQIQQGQELPTLFTTQSVGTPVFALGPNNTYYYIKYSTILDQQVWFNAAVPAGSDIVNQIW